MFFSSFFQSLKYFQDISGTVYVHTVRNYYYISDFFSEQEIRIKYFAILASLEWFSEFISRSFKMKVAIFIMYSSIKVDSCDVYPVVTAVHEKSIN